MSRKQIRHRPNLRRKARARPHRWQRLCCRTANLGFLLLFSIIALRAIYLSQNFVGDFFPPGGWEEWPRAPAIFLEFLSGIPPTRSVGKCPVPLQSFSNSVGYSSHQIGGKMPRASAIFLEFCRVFLPPDRWGNAPCLCNLSRILWGIPPTRSVGKYPVPLQSLSNPAGDSVTNP